MNNILWNVTARLPRIALLFVACMVASASAVLAQTPDVTESQKSQPVSDGQTQSMFEHQVGSKLWISGQVNFIF